MPVRGQGRRGRVRMPAPGRGGGAGPGRGAAPCGGAGCGRMTSSMCSGLHSSAAGRALLGLTWLTLAGIIGAVWLTFGGFLSTLDDSGLGAQAVSQDGATFSLAPSSKVAKTPHSVSQAHPIMPASLSRFRPRSARPATDECRPLQLAKPVVQHQAGVATPERNADEIGDIIGHGRSRLWRLKRNWRPPG